MATPTRRLIALMLGVGVFVTVGLLWWMTSNEPEPLPAFPYGELRIGVDASFPPFASVAPDGELQGLDVDLGYAIAEHLNVPVSFTNIGIDGLYDALLSDRVDILISALSADDWRLQDVAYTVSYFDAGLVLVTPADSEIITMRDMPGHTLAYEFGSPADEETRLWSRRIPEFETQPYELPQYALDSVRIGVADAALVDAVSAHLYMDQHPDWQPQMHSVKPREYVIAVQFFRGETFDAVNGALVDLIENGTVDAIIEAWL